MFDKYCWSSVSKNIQKASLISVKKSNSCLPVIPKSSFETSTTSFSNALFIYINF